MKYKKPNIIIVEVSAELLTMSEMGPGATDIFAPDVSNNSKSIWDDEESDNTLFNIKEENYGEDWI